MVGYADVNAVWLWAQTTRPADVRIEYWPKGNPQAIRSTLTVHTQPEKAFTAHLAADSVSPGTRYEYRLVIDNQTIQLPWSLEFQTPALWQYRTQPPTYTLAMGSCLYVNDSCSRPGEPYGGGYHILRTIDSLRPDLMLWLGDNTYFRECDWTSPLGLLRRHSHTRALPELQPLLGHTHHLAIWDDHDYGPNDADRSYILKDAAQEAFKLFWANPTYGLPGQGGITTMFQWGNEDYFLLDNRYFRSVNARTTGTRTMLGDAQIEWLIDALKRSDADFKFVVMGGQFLNDARVYENYSNLFPEERQRIINAIIAERISGVVFLDGDRHHTELSVFKPEGFYPIHDLTVSPLTAKAATMAGTEPNTLRVAGTLVTERNFATLRIEGPRRNRVMTITVYDANGVEKWTHTIRSAELRVGGE
jgi:alkaline phosphatase D